MNTKREMKKSMYGHSNLPSIDEIIEKRKNMQRCCEYCADPENDYKPVGDCATCETLKRHNQELDTLADELKALPVKEPIINDEYMFEFVCGCCKFNSHIEIDNGYWTPPDHEGWCALFDDHNEDAGESADRCAGRFFIQDPKKDAPYMTHAQYIGNEPLPGEEE